MPAKKKATVKTVATAASVEAFIQTVPSEQRRADATKLIRLMRQITKHPPKMWGPSIIGFDQYHYVYDTGREGDMCALGFSPRKDALVIYLVDGVSKYAADLARLGKTTHGKSCLYVKSLADVRLEVLAAMLEKSYRATKQGYS